VIAIRGHFSGRCAASGEGCSASSRGAHSYGSLDERSPIIASVIVLVINARSARLEDFGIGDVYPDLRGLGPVTTDYRR